MKDQKEAAEGKEADAELEEQGRKQKAYAAPRKPSKAEVDDHNLTHWPFRNWCQDCVQGRAINSPHYSVDQEKKGERRLPLIAADYIINVKKVSEASDEDKENGEEISGDMQKDGEAKMVVSKILVVADFKSKAVLCFGVPVKGAGLEWIPRRGLVTREYFTGRIRNLLS